MKEKGLECNMEKSFFGKTEMEYLVFWVKHDGVKPININTSNKTIRNQRFFERSYVNL